MCGCILKIIIIIAGSEELSSIDPQTPLNGDESVLADHSTSETSSSDLDRESCDGSAVSNIDKPKEITKPKGSRLCVVLFANNILCFQGLERGVKRMIVRWMSLTRY